MSRTVKKVKIGYAEYDADSPTLDLQEGAAHIQPEGLESFAELFQKLSGLHWFCEVGEA